MTRKRENVFAVMTVKISNVWAANMYVAKELWVWTIEQMFLLQYPCLGTKKKTAYKMLSEEK